jgi:6-phosphogluconolactonase
MHGYRAVIAARVALLLAVLGLCVQPAAASHGDGAVYVMTNKASANSVIQFDRRDDGRLIRRREVRSGGRGSGGTLDPLMSQDSLIQSPDGHFLLAVNAGSNELSVFVVGRERLHLVNVVASRGTFPNSIALHGDLVYVLNARGTPNIAGFRLDPFGRLHPIANSRRALPGGAAAVPINIRFSHDGMRLVVTESGTNQIDIFEVGDDGRTGAVVTEASAGVMPFGFKFGRDSILLSTEAGTGSTSSYRLRDDNQLDAISPAVTTGQMATCWISLTRSGRYAYVSNTRSATLSSYSVARDGTLTLLEAVAASTGAGSAPIDSALSRDSRFLYVVDSTLGRVLAFKANAGTLTAIGRRSGLPVSVQGIVAR